jgi:DNA-nicking Smr family endonuclease
VSNRTGKRDRIRTLDVHEDFYELFGARNGEDTAPEPSCEDEEPFSRMLEAKLSGANQAEIIRQKYPEHPLESKKHQTGFFAKPQSELDLHGCHVHEALVRVEAFLETAAMQGMNTVLIIVGKGLHSQGSAVLPDAVEKKIVDLKRRGRVAAFTWEKKHKRASGALLVYLK